jgi:YbbR domain-containing protein
MAANTTVLIIVAAVAALLLAGMAAVVMYKTRTPQRHVKGDTIRDQAEENDRHVRYQESLADVYAVTAHAAQVEVDIKTARACRLQRQAAVHRGEAITSRAQLNEQSSRADKPRVAAHTSEIPRLAG